MTRSSEYTKSFREGLAAGPRQTFAEFVDAETFPLDTEADRELLRETQRGYKDGRAARAAALKTAGVSDV